MLSKLVTPEVLHDASSSDDDDSDDDMTTNKKVLASIAINEKSSFFDTPSTCFMAKATKV